jgi:hypothetical protein
MKSARKVMVLGSSDTVLVPLHSNLKHAVFVSAIQPNCLFEYTKACFRCECKGTNAVSELPTCFLLQSIPEERTGCKKNNQRFPST